MPEPRLPDRFHDLEPLAEVWALSTEAERHARRLASGIEELRAFYDAVFPRIGDILAYMSEFPLDSLTPESHACCTSRFRSLKLGRQSNYLGNRRFQTATTRVVSSPPMANSNSATPKLYLYTVLRRWAL
jgi:hypothetical protein